jgi:hypothetical protein
VTTPAFIEIGEDDLPVTPASPLTPPPTAEPPPVRRGGRPRSANTTEARATRRYRHDRAAQARGEALTVANPNTAPDVIEDPINVDTDDLAAVVVRRTLTQLAAGKVQPTLKDGLTAQQLLDRRAEKAADRSFMLNLALALAGGGKRTPVKYLPNPADADPDVIEGDFVEQNLAPDHLRQA